jgi:hypothetical protein
MLLSLCVQSCRVSQQNVRRSVRAAGERSLVGCAKLANKTSVPPSVSQASAGTPDSRHASSRWLVCQRPQRARHIYALRCPSEHLGLWWDDVNWGENRITIHSPKTDHHEGGESRVIPIFPELRPYIDAAWEAAEPGADYVITRYRDTNTSLRTRMLKIIERAGLKPWPKLFQNLRSSRQTELEDVFPGHVVCKWMGNSQRVADEHFRRGCEEPTDKAAHNPAKQQTEMAGNDKKLSEVPAAGNPVISEENGNFPKSAGSCRNAKWAMRDSNPRPPRCKRGALTN